MMMYNQLSYDLSISDIAPGEMTYISGWGTTFQGSGNSDVLMGVEIPIISNEDAFEIVTGMKVHMLYQYCAHLIQVRLQLQVIVEVPL